MNFLVEGVNFTNKGAELMLHAVKQQIHGWDDENTISLHLRIGNFKQRTDVEVSHLLWLRFGKIPFATPSFNIIANLTPKNIRERYNFILESEIDVVLDASGFCFSDQWGARATEEKLKLYSRWKKQGKKIILLPQAFGPFSSDKIQQAFRKVVEISDLVFARDRISFEHINKFNNPKNNIRIAPDFTNLVEGVEPPYFNTLLGRPCIIPNQRMIDKTSLNVGDNYLSSLASIAEYLIEKGLDPFILIHEKDDCILGKELQNSIAKNITVVEEDNSLFLKSILGKCSFVVSSRFHGLVSALSQGVPCIGTGWSHKYEMLFQDYNCLELLIDSNNINNVLEKLDLLICEATRTKIIHDLEISGSNLKALSKVMWSEVQQIINV
ncbi:MAG: polysaccharide pyruvyl transferase family protein [Richelia sp. RM2_1_2]|nr:polysaccharide pyruvyl transferase family protein [Richelia sp. RM2_1_2]